MGTTEETEEEWEIQIQINIDTADLIPSNAGYYTYGKGLVEDWSTNQTEYVGAPKSLDTREPTAFHDRKRLDPKNLL